MAIQHGTDPLKELDLNSIYRDPRPGLNRFFGALFKPTGFLFAQGVVVVFIMAYPLLAPYSLFLNVPFVFIYKAVQKRQTLPFKIPLWAGLTGLVKNDYNEFDEKRGRPPAPPKGILYLGNQRDIFSGKNEEIWLTNSDIRMHFALFGTTGAGKTERLLSHVFNALCWGSGFIYVDGKADNSLWYKIYTMVRRVGREDDLLVLNFMQGGKEHYETGKTFLRDSNSMNPTARGSSDFISSLVTSMMPEVSGDSANWREKAVGMIESVIKILTYKRFTGHVLIDPGVLRENLSLQAIIKLAVDEKIPDDIRAPIVAYLDNLSGFDMDIWKAQKKFDPEADKQHGYLASQFIKLLGMLNDTYGKIFKHQLAEVDMVDVVLNNRILVVLIPSLEKSDIESEGLGRLIVSVLRLMMAITLGDRIEGAYEDIVESKMTNAPAPYIGVFDEAGYYYTKGFNVQFAQARSLGFSLTIAGQDEPSLSKDKNKQEVKTVLGNTKVKEGMAIEDATDTFDLFLKAGGEAYEQRMQGYSGESGMLSHKYTDNMNIIFEKRSRITLQEMQALQAGESLILHRGKIVRSKAFYVFRNLKINKKQKVRVNQFLEVFPPTIDELEGFIREPEFIRKKFRPERIVRMLETGKKIDFSIDNKNMPEMLKILQQASAEVEEKNDLSPEEIGVCMYMRVRQLLFKEELPQRPVCGRPPREAEAKPKREKSKDLSQREDNKGFDPVEQFDRLQNKSFSNLMREKLIEVEREAGEDDPEKRVDDLMSAVRMAMDYVPIATPGQVKTLEEIADIWTSIEQEIANIEE